MGYTAPFIYYPIRALQYYTKYNTNVNILPFVRYYYFSLLTRLILKFYTNLLIKHIHLLI